MDFLQKIKAVWQNVSLVQQALLIAIVLTIVTVGVLLTQWAGTPDMGVLYANLNPEEAAKIAEKLGETGIVYQLGQGGATIYVPQENVSQLRLDMAKEGLPQAGQKGYGIFDNEKIGISPFVQNVNLKRALQDELAKSIQMIDGIIYARIHIVSSKQRVFASQTNNTTASVVLQLRSGYRLSAVNIAAITHMIAGGVEGLNPEGITVVDSQGRLLSSDSDEMADGGAGGVASYRERVEQSLAKKAEDILIAVLGPGRSRVRVSAEINMTSSSSITETPIKGIPKKEEIKSSSEIKAGRVLEEGGATVPGDTKKDETIVTDYSLGRNVVEKVILPGTITALTVAVVVDLSPPERIKTEGEEQTEVAEVEPIMKVEEVKSLIKNALGLKETDTIDVVETKFHRLPESLIGDDEGGKLDIISIARNSSLGIMAVCALLALKIFGSAGKKAGDAAGQLAGAGPAGLLSGDTETSEPMLLRRQISSALKADPEQVRELFSSWVEGRG